MLRSLTVNNVALISALELEFCGQLNILSGETGAGKSIIVDSLMLLLGERYDKTLLRYGQKSGFVEGVFDLTDAVRPVAEEMGFDGDDMIIVNRRFNDEGRNEIRINGKLCTTSMLRGLMARLVDIYGQNEYQSLSKPAEHMRILDYYVRHNTSDLLIRLAETYKKLKKVVKEFDELGDAQQRARNIDMLRYQIDEIDGAKIKEGEEDELVDRRKMILGAEKINESLGELVRNLSDGDPVSASELVSSSVRALRSLASVTDRYDEFAERLESVAIEIEDVADSVADELDRMSFDERDLDALEKRLDLVRSLKRKYGSVEKMRAFRAEAEETLDRLENGAELYEKLSAEKESLVRSCYDLSVQISEIRKRGAKELEKSMIAELSELGMNESRFEIVFEPLPALEACEGALTPGGLDKVEFYLSPNAGQPLKPLAKIISGGEMSRFMLALKVISSENDDIPTLIFDEVDTGISGSVGQAVAKKLARLSRSHQVLCVTHLPQIASMADNHYFISKSVRDDVTNTEVRLLDGAGMVDEISRLSGAKDISKQSAQNAREMKEWSDSYKKSLK